MTIAQFGTFDVGNYGDLMFPLIARWRWPDVDWVHISPIGGFSPFTDSLLSIGYKQAKKRSFDGIIVGGGNILSTRSTNLKDYSSLASIAYPSIWIGAAQIAHNEHIPLVFNAPSIMTKKFRKIEKLLGAAIFKNAAYLSMRDGESSRIATETGVKCSLVPDSVFDISRMWPKAELIAKVDLGYIAVHVNHRYQGSFNSLITTLHKLSELRQEPIHLLPIAPCHGDRETALALASELEGEATVASVSTLHDIAREIAGSSLYIGSSMHGFITAISYGIPALLVLEGKTPMRKFEGVLNAVGAKFDTIASSWEKAINSLDKAFTIDPEMRTLIEHQLDTHWAIMRTAIDEGNPCQLPWWFKVWRPALKIAATAGKCKKYIARALK